MEEEERKRRNAERMRRYREQNPEKCRAYNLAYKRKWRELNVEKVAEHRRRFKDSGGWKRQKLKKYGLTLEQYQEMLAKQNFGCAICKRKTPGGRGDFPVDHCHKTGEVRGLLCNDCNQAIGLFKENKGFMSSAIAYLSEGEE